MFAQIRREAQPDRGAPLSPLMGPGGGRDDLAAHPGRAARLEPPVQLEPKPGFATALALRLPGEPELVLADDPALLRELREAFAAAEIAHRISDDWPIDVDAVFAAALSPTVALPGGGSLHIEESRAAVLIDVDTGTPEGGSFERAALATNLAATAAISRQLRRRRIGAGV